MELYERALAQRFISVDDAKRFNDTELNNLIVSDSINGAKPKSLFNVDESIAERVKLQNNVISQSDFNQVTTEQKQEFISNGIYPSKDAPTMLTNMPFILKREFEAMTPSERQKVIDSKVEVKEFEEVIEFDAYRMARTLEELQNITDNKDGKEA